MEVVQLVEEARMLGALFDVRYGKTQVYGCLAPGELTLELVAKLHDNRERIPGHLFDYERCAVCTCATEGARLPPICPLCQSMYCVQCGACTAFRSQWTPSWAEPGARDQLLPEILSRLREGHEWFCQQTKNFYYALSDAGDAAFARAEAK